MLKMKTGIDKFFKKLPEKTLIKINIELMQNKFNGIVGTISQMIMTEYDIDIVYVITIIRNNVQEILSDRYIKLKEKINKKK